MKITEAEYEENRCESRKFYINHTLFIDSIKLVAFVIVAVAVLMLFQM